MGYIKKLKSNELVGGTDKTTIYPVTSAEAVFEEVIEDGESNFKSQKFLNNNITGDRINEGTITDYNIATGTITKGKLTPQVQTMLDEGQKKAITPKGDYNSETVYEALDLVFDTATNSSYVSLITPNTEPLTNENAWEMFLDGTAVNTAQAAIDAKVDQLNNQVAGAIGQAQQDVQALINNTAAALQEATNDAIGATEAAMAAAHQKVSDAQIGYYISNTAAATATKQTTTNIVGEDEYVPASGGAVKVYMQYANTATGTVELQFGTNTATRKPLLYNGEPVSRDNTWENKEVLSVYYDPTYNNNTGAYQATNVQGGGNGVKGAIDYVTRDVPLIALNTNYAVDNRVKNAKGEMLRVVKPVTSLKNTETLAIGDLKTAATAGKTYKAIAAILNFADTTVEEGVYALGYPAKKTLTLTMPENVSEGNIDITFNGVALNTVAITESKAVSDITAEAIAGKTITGWELSASGNVITANATNAGASSAAFVLTDTGNTGITGTPESVNGGGSTIAQYSEGVWVPKAVADLKVDTNLFSEISLDGNDGLIALITEPNSVTQDFDHVSGLPLYSENLFVVENAAAYTKKSTNITASSSGGVFTFSIVANSVNSKFWVGVSNSMRLIRGRKYRISLRYTNNTIGAATARVVNTNNSDASCGDFGSLATGSGVIDTVFTPTGTGNALAFYMPSQNRPNTMVVRDIVIREVRTIDEYKSDVDGISDTLTHSYGETETVNLVTSTTVSNNTYKKFFTLKSNTQYHVKITLSRKPAGQIILSSMRWNYSDPVTNLVEWEKAIVYEGDFSTTGLTISNTLQLRNVASADSGIKGVVEVTPYLPLKDVVESNAKKFNDVSKYNKVDDYKLVWREYTGNNPIPTNRVAFEAYASVGFGQGTDVWNDYAIALSVGLSDLKVADLRSKKLIYNQSSGLGNVAARHANCQNFTTEYYDPSDEFPLLLVSGGESRNGVNELGVAYLIRILRNGESFSCSIVQTIRITSGYYESGGNSYLFEKYSNIAVDKRTGHLYVVNNGIAEDNAHRIFEIPMPALFDSDHNVISDVTLTTDDIIRCIPFTGESMPQGNHIHNGVIYINYGTSNYFIVAIDLVSGNVINKIRLNNIGFNLEPEDVSFWGEDMLIFAVDTIYRVHWT